MVREWSASISHSSDPQHGVPRLLHMAALKSHLDERQVKTVFAREPTNGEFKQAPDAKLCLNDSSTTQIPGILCFLMAYSRLTNVAIVLVFNEQFLL